MCKKNYRNFASKNAFINCVSQITNCNILSMYNFIRLYHKIMYIFFPYESWDYIFPCKDNKALVSISDVYIIM